jgi:hypothetical protein
MDRYTSNLRAMLMSWVYKQEVLQRNFTQSTVLQTEDLLMVSIAGFTTFYHSYQAQRTQKHPNPKKMYPMIPFSILIPLKVLILQ